MGDQRVVMGFDVGGTKTACVLLDSAGTVLGKGFGGSGNTNFIALEIAQKSFTDAIEMARVQAGVASLAVDCVVVGTEPSPDPVAPLIERLTGTRRVVHKKEGECSMVGGLVAKVGLSLICGTGSVGWGRNAAGQTSMTSCWGPIGDEGSAYDLARRGVNAAFWAWDGRGPRTLLVDLLLAMFKQTDMREVCTPLYTSENLRKDFASLAQLVTQAADQDDAVALQVLRDGAAQIAHFLATCANNLGMTEYRVASSNSGLVTGSDYRYHHMIAAALAQIHPQAELVKPRFEPVVGAGLCALDEVGVAWAPAVVDRIAATWVKA